MIPLGAPRTWYRIRQALPVGDGGIPQDGGKRGCSGKASWGRAWKGISGVHKGVMCFWQRSMCKGLDVEASESSSEQTRPGGGGAVMVTPGGRCHLSSEEDGKRPEVGLRNSEEARVWGARVHLRGQQGSVRWALLGTPRLLPSCQALAASSFCTCWQEFSAPSLAAPATCYLTCSVWKPVRARTLGRSSYLLKLFLPCGLWGESKVGRRSHPGSKGGPLRSGTTKTTVAHQRVSGVGRAADKKGHFGFVLVLMKTQV
ncbi:hypothetical protein Cadr_000024921 [Camelus dromedarius]|uniref:Uncharacterized protein n=1 Tax=Camelus dromedarius TaxID=9838 RepID=A0A5N4CQ68_CAMDR|nr:hypothetical protein Cadr_000024921 [Camelus dromedarius]